MASKILGIAFTVLFLALTWLLLLVSIHGAESLPYFALAYVIVALVVFWTVYLWVGRRLARHRPAWLLLTGGALVGLAFSLPPLANNVSQTTESRIRAAIKVSDVRDSVLLSKGGNPIGIRMTYSIEFPSTGYRAPSPFLTPEDPYLNESSVSFSMRGINQSITPTLERENLSHRGVRYSFATDLIPAFIQENKSETRLCISQAFAGPMQARVEEILRTPKGEKKTRFRVAISDTDYGMRESRGGDQFTQGAYSLKTFYESAVRDGARDCGSNTNNASEPILAPPQDSR